MKSYNNSISYNDWMVDKRFITQINLVSVQSHGLPYYMMSEHRWIASSCNYSLTMWYNDYIMSAWWPYSLRVDHIHSGELHTKCMITYCLWLRWVFTYWLHCCIHSEMIGQRLSEDEIFLWNDFQISTTLGWLLTFNCAYKCFYDISGLINSCWLMLLVC